MFPELIGATIHKITGCRIGSQEVQIHTDKGTLTLTHKQSCCEHSEVDDINGDPGDLIGATVRAFRVKEKQDGEMKWTFYEISTGDDDLMIKWLGDLSVGTGYYSVAVTVEWYNGTRPLQKGDVLMHQDTEDMVEILYKSCERLADGQYHDVWVCKSYSTNQEILISCVPAENGLYNGVYGVYD